ncbi:unnamed protein product [Acanthocheilonema viteae]|uniref:Uncharacterized protein n=1 Tax=Acanthocheilonema viteae TaxID=6277 RepID=A0A498SBT5_ACAVI|nr:unnamed protein product [Acanthocheilonema viteae]
MRSSDSIEAVPHHQDSAIQESFTDPIGYTSQWWTKHRARRRSQFNTKILTTTTTTTVTVPITVVSTTVITPTVTVNSGFLI